MGSLSVYTVFNLTVIKWKGACLRKNAITLGLQYRQVLLYPQHFRSWIMFQWEMFQVNTDKSWLLKIWWILPRLELHCFHWQLGGSSMIRLLGYFNSFLWTKNTPFCKNNFQEHNTNVTWGHTVYWLIFI